MFRSKGLGIPLWLLLPAFIPIVAFSVLPLVQGIYLGFTNYELGGGNAQFITYLDC